MSFMSPRFKVHVLGHFRLLRVDAPIDMRGRARKPQEFLQVLIALGGREVGAGALIEALWPDSEGDAAHHALESTLYRLRQLLGQPDAVRMAGRKVSLDRDQFWVDMWEFEQELQRSRDAGTSVTERIEHLRRSRRTQRPRRCITACASGRHRSLVASESALNDSAVSVR